MVTGNITISANSALTGFTGITSVDSVNGNITVSDNAALTDIDDLFGDVIYIEGNLTISNNTTLDECCVVTKFTSGEAYINGSLSIAGNNTNCASLAAIIPYCNTTQSDTDDDDVIDSVDNCSDVSNPDQTDTDGDGIGDACDNCPENANPTQDDADNNGIGDVCQSDMSVDTGTSSGGVGIGTTTPNSQLEITTGDVFINNKYRGIIMKATNGKCFRYQPDKDGKLLGKEITCPDN
ncbi:hypothetical protein EZY14_015985 [Kordia sp. TARA_039_SRF]|nr:hypothetical protein EZY14_015985 [Kordia sp. TARA_039_SRF]